MSTPLSVTLVLPCLNEALAIQSCIEEAQKVFKDEGWEGEVLVVDNGSTDNSIEIAIAAGARVIIEEVKGYGAALRRGIEEASGEIVVMADADATYPLDRMSELVYPVASNELDLAVGGRLDETNRKSMPLLHRYVGTPILSWLIRGVTGKSELADSQSGFRAFKKTTMRSLNLESSGMEFASEMLIRSVQGSLTVSEIQLGYRPRIGESKLNTWSDGYRHVRLIVRAAPYIPLFYPGIVAMALGMILSLITLSSSRIISVGSLGWQPIFFGMILSTAGLISTICGAVLGRYSTGASPQTRHRLRWVSSKLALRGLQMAAIVVLLVGLLLDFMLFLKWIDHSRVSVTHQLHWAELSQELLIYGVILFAAASIGLLIAPTPVSTSLRNEESRVET